MDTTEEYIKMCRKAKKVQDMLKNLKAGDFIYIEDITKFDYGIKDPIICCGQMITNNVDSYILYDGHDGSQIFFRDWFTWLPQQDDLQEMVDSEFTTYELFDMFDNEFLEEYSVGGVVRCPYWIDNGWSMEKFWLAYVMKNNFKKMWDGEDWMPKEND